MRAEVKHLARHGIRLSRSAWQGLADHFIPQQRNSYQPHALKHRVLFGYSVILILVKVLAIVLPVALPSSSLYSSSITPQNIVDLTNQTRQNLGLSELKVNTKLAAAAEAKANDMIGKQYFAHTSPSGTTPWDWLARAGYDYVYAGENLAVHYSSTEEEHDGWLASPTHRANIVNHNYTEIGVGVVNGEFEGVPTTVAVQMFGQPVTVATLVPIAPQPQPKAPTQPPALPSNTGQVAAAERTVKKVEPVTKPRELAVKPATPPVTQPANTTPPQEPTLPAVNKPTIATAPILPPVVYDASLKVKPIGNVYDVKLVVTGAIGVTAQLASEWIPLVRQKLSDVWQGQVPFEQAVAGSGGEQLSVVAWGKGDTVTTKPLLWIAPQVKTQQFYTFNEGSDKYAKFFGGLLTVHNLNDSVRQFYLYFMVFLGVALLLNILIKIRIQFPSIINHALLVLALTLFLVIV